MEKKSTLHKGDLMKVTNELERILLEQQSAQTKKTKNANDVDFAKVLNEQFKIQEASAKGIEMPTSSNQAISGFAGMESITVGDISGALLTTMKDTMNVFTSYTKSLVTDKKSAWAQLDNVSVNLDSLRKTNPNLAERDPEMHTMLNEMEVLATTEKFKFNRGDYI